MNESNDMVDWGVSVVVCCYNSAERLPATLSYLASQQIDQDLQWEVIVIDNASTDNTAQTAESSWPKWAPNIMHVVTEPRLGLRHARERGLSEAQYEIVAFVDDDNWVHHNWVQLASQIMREHPEVGACGGHIQEAVYESEPPSWLGRYIRLYAVGTQEEKAKTAEGTQGSLWGAGMIVRKSAWQRLVDNGFHLLVDGRRGSRLTSGEDVELCFALRLAGWRLQYDPRLKLRHFLPANRMTWDYLRQLQRGAGAANLARVPYRFALEEKDDGVRNRLKRMWYFQTAVSVIRLIRYGYLLIPAVRSSREGNERVLQVERELGRLSELLRQRDIFQLRIREVQMASWKAPQASVD